MNDDLASMLGSGTLMLTPNQRAARTLQDAHDAAMLASGNLTWSPANVLPLEVWMASLWSQLLVAGHEERLLLNRAQQQVLWDQIIASDPDIPGLLSTEQLADMAARAWAQLCLYSGRGSLRDYALSLDTRAFARWASIFERQCRRQACIVPAELPDELTRALPLGGLDLPAEGLALVDFDPQPPAVELLFHSLERAGYPVNRVRTTTVSKSMLFAAEDENTEIEAAARWARERLDTAPGCRIAIVVPQLEARRDTIDRIFTGLLDAAAQPITAASRLPVYEFSLGRSLALAAPVANALTLLRWTAYPLPIESISTLLLSPFVAGTALLEAASFDVHSLRQLRLLRPELTLGSFLELALLPPSLRTRLGAFQSAAVERHLGTPDRQTYAGWADAFRATLQAVGWPLLAARDSLSYQARERFDSVLDELATLDFLPVQQVSTRDTSAAAQPTAATALATLTRLTSQTIFAPESRAAPIQVMGPLELGGQPFDFLWLLSADDLTWPPISGASPLLPFALQRSLGIPAADPGLARRNAELLTARVLSSAPETVVSYAGAERRPSSLLPSLDAFQAEPALVSDPFATELFPDTAPLPALPDAPIRGGASILQLQAACPFRAFAERRLHSSAPDAAATGLDARDRGSDVHRVMEQFWSEVQHADALKALPITERDHLLDRCIDHALSHHNSRTPWDHAYLAVQRERLRRLLRPWLELETSRPTFVVLHHEREDRDLRLGPLRLNLRVDRVDETESGELIIDYKTGLATPSDWFTDRPEAPQLPLYAALSDRPPAGIAFAILRPGQELALKGVASDEKVLSKGPYLDMPLQLEDWRRVLTALAESFAAGIATVDPRRYPRTCDHCQQRIFCRLNPENLNPEEETPSA